MSVKIPYNQSVIELAAKFGCELSPRSCAGGFLWDGKTLACHWQRWSGLVFDFDAGKVATLDFLATPDARLFEPKLRVIPVGDLLHDVAHHAVAEVWQRDLPEWGLGIVDFLHYNANGGLHKWDEGYRDTVQMSPGAPMALLDEPDADHQEHLAYLLGLYFCERLGVELANLVGGKKPKGAEEVGHYWLHEYEPGERRHSCVAELSKRFGIQQGELERIVWSRDPNKGAM